MKSENSVLSVEQILRRAGSPGYVESTVAVKSEQLIRKVNIHTTTQCVDCQRYTPAE
jgi:hypothetical protein